MLLAPKKLTSTPERWFEFYETQITTVFHVVTKDDYTIAYNSFYELIDTCSTVSERQLLQGMFYRQHLNRVADLYYKTHNFIFGCVAFVVDQTRQSFLAQELEREYERRLALWQRSQTV